MSRRGTFLANRIIVETETVGDTYYGRPAGAHSNTPDGLTYETAWLGIDNIITGADANMSPGDQLMLAGTFIPEITSNTGIASQNRIMLGVSGQRMAYLTVRGDYAGDPGVIWGVWKDSRTGSLGLSAQWSDLGGGIFEGTTVLGTKNWARHGLWKEAADGTMTKMTPVASHAAVANPGEYFHEEAVSGQNQSKLTFYDPDATSFADFTANHLPSVRFSGVCGGRLVWGEGTQWIRIMNLTFRANEITHETETAVAGPYGNYELLNLDCICYQARHWWDPWNTQHVKVDNCTVRKAGNGLYGITNQGDISDFTVTQNTFTDIGVTWSEDPINPVNIDAHCVAVMNNRDWLIDNNTCDNSGLAIDAHCGNGVTQRNIKITNNTITNQYDALSTASDRGEGIKVEGDQDNPASNESGIVVKGNTVTNCDNAGITSSRATLVDVSDNTVSGCDISYKFIRSRAEGTSAVFNNNHSDSPGTYHIYFNNNFVGTSYEYRADANNTYSDDKSNLTFYFLDNGAAPDITNYTDYLANHSTAGNDVQS